MSEARKQFNTARTHRALERLTDRLRAEFIEPKNIHLREADETQRFQIRSAPNKISIYFGKTALARVTHNHDDGFVLKIIEHSEDHKPQTSIITDRKEDIAFYALTFQMAAEMPIKAALKLQDMCERSHTRTRDQTPALT